MAHPDTHEHGLDPELPLRDYPIAYPLSVGRVRAGEWASSVPDQLVAEGRYGRVAPPDLAGADLDVGAPAQGERVLADDLGREIFLDVPAHALDDGHDRDEEHHADHHAEAHDQVAAGQRAL